MSCSCSCNPCTCGSGCNTDNEPLSSALNNFVTAFFGSVSKSCVNGQTVWILPCDLEAGSPDFPRNPNEGLACYFMRFANAFFSTQFLAPGNTGYRLTTLAATDVVLVADVDVINQDFNGTLTAPVNIDLSSSGAVNGKEFFISFDDLVITATNNIEIRSDSTSLLVINTAGTLNGLVKAVYTGTAWTLTLTSVNVT